MLISFCAQDLCCPQDVRFLWLQAAVFTRGPRYKVHCFTPTFVLFIDFIVLLLTTVKTET